MICSNGAISEIGSFSWGWDSLVAIGTLLLGAATVWLAYTTRQLAQAGRDDQRAQWRPVLTPGAGEAPVSYDDETGHMEFEVRNVGRGPAFGMNAQLRSGRSPLGASVPSGPGKAVALAPGGTFIMRCRISKPAVFSRGSALEAEISYYDITERWHRSLFTIVGSRRLDKLSDYSVVPDLAVAKVFTYETDQEVRAVLGSPKASDRAAREERKLWARIKRLRTGSA